ncbi:MAG: hypothetical protein NTY85_06700, partial [Actinobacteria bacterium]|nr:hypothetical protein [Actinomycetota bacterium]
MPSARPNPADISYRIRMKIYRDFQIKRGAGLGSKWKTWEEIDAEFGRLAEQRLIHNFRRSALVLETMEYQRADARVFSKELADRGVIESPLGNPLKPLFYRNSLNLGHQYRHLKMWSSKPESELGKVTRVVEFGGGFGMMCWLVFQLGFSGEYLIVDNEGTSKLQKKYLENTLTTEQFKKVSWLESVDLIQPRIAENDLFIALWSASETPDVILRNV